MTRRRNAFTLLELLIVVAIIMILSGMMFVGAQMAQRRAKIERSRAVITILAGASDQYWADYHDYPLPNPSYIGGSVKLASKLASSTLYGTGPGNWTNRAQNVGLVYLFGQPRNPEPYISLQQAWFLAVKTNPNNPKSANVKGPDGRDLFYVVDGFGNEIFIERYYMNDPLNYYYNVLASDIRFTSYGPDGQYSGANPSGGTYEKDNIAVYLKR